MAQGPALPGHVLGRESVEAYLRHAIRGLSEVVLNAGLCALAPIVRRTDPAAARLVLAAIADEPAFITPGGSG
ncbi:MAG TPA: hypothetical protein VHZ33_27260 [Trebonia sp.]|jgi:hypothetical protein|nr:hypothetical protein [Trebonia sp.]